jgi:hypothetical protein
MIPQKLVSHTVNTVHIEIRLMATIMLGWINGWTFIQLIEV